MKNTLNVSNTRDLVAPYDVVSGAAFKVGGYIAVAATSAKQGAPLSADIRGAFTLPKAAGAAWGLGDVLYWDDAAKNFTKTAAGNTKAALALLPALAGDTTGAVDLFPSI